MPKLHALIVAVGEYPIAGHRLRGCAADFDTMNFLLERQAALYNMEYVCHTLQDAQATRAAIIQGFDDAFSQAGAEDFCVFYFSGHGSFAPVDDVFYNNSSGRNESLVCYDSRLPGGRDLMDKELAYLSHRSMQAGKPTFVSILDCCHSGSAFRSSPSSEQDHYAVSRQTPAAGFVAAKDYLGYDDYHDIDGKKQPPIYPTVHLAACKPHQLAQERTINGIPQGVFTYCLSRELSLADPLISAEELMRRVNSRTTGINPKQFPFLEGLNEKRKQQPLFTTTEDNTATFFTHRFQISYQGSGWFLNAGAQQGIQKGTADHATILTEEDGTEWKVVQVEAMRAKVETTDKDLQRDAIYTAQLKHNGRAQLSIALAPDLPEEWVEAFRTVASQFPALNLLLEEEEATSYRIDALVDSAILVRDGEEYPVFERVEMLGGGGLIASAEDFLYQVNSVAGWEAVRAISNPNTSIPDNHIQVEIKISDGAAQEHTKTAFAEPVLLHYHRKDGEEVLPRFQVKVTNNSERKYWISAVYASSDFGITNEFLPGLEFGPKKSYYLGGDGSATDEPTWLEGYLDDRYRSWSITEIEDYLQLFISTHHELDTSVFNQGGLSLDEKDLDRSEGIDKGIRRASPRQDAKDWTVKNIALRTIRPLDELNIGGGFTQEMSGMRIEAPEGFSAKAKMGSMESGNRSLAHPLPPALAGGEMLSFNDMSGSRNLSGNLNVLELSRVTNGDAVSADTPLKLKMQQQFAKNESVIPFGLDPESGMYYPLGYMDEEGDILIQDIPPEVAQDRSLFGSLKIFFQKIVGSKLGIELDYPLLRRVAEDADGVLVYADENLEQIKAVIDAAEVERVVVFVHGIIGDTTTSTALLQHVAQLQQGKFSDHYQAVLTFDYENLGTNIDQTAKDFLKKLQDLGFGSNGKALHIFAHSMGGLVSRWMIEKEGGDQVVDHLFTFGTPHGGSPWSNVAELLTTGITYAINGATVSNFWMLPLLGVQRLWKASQTTLEEMKPGGAFMKRLNDGAEAPIPYTLISGNTQLIQSEKEAERKSFLRRLIYRFRHQPHYALLDMTLFDGPNDIAVSLESQQNVRGQLVRKPAPVACDHMVYFQDPDSVELVSQLLSEADS